MIIGVTGSRDWTDREEIKNAFDKAAEDFDAIPRKTLLIEGGAGGADTLCRVTAYSRAWHVATVKALWATYGKPAGYIRNDAMIALGRHADCWLAFIKPCITEDCRDGPGLHDSHGAAHCAERAELAGIEVRRYGWRF